MNLSELRMYCTSREYVDVATFKCVLSTLSALVGAWEKQQRDMEQKKQEDEALYVTK